MFEYGTCATVVYDNDGGMCVDQIALFVPVRRHTSMLVARL
jgi:hypothetical protein